MSPAKERGRDQRRQMERPLYTNFFNDAEQRKKPQKMNQKSNSPFENIPLASLSVKYSVTKISCQAMLIKTMKSFHPPCIGF